MRKLAALVNAINEELGEEDILEDIHGAFYLGEEE